MYYSFLSLFTVRYVMSSLTFRESVPVVDSDSGSDSDSDWELKAQPAKRSCPDIITDLPSRSTSSVRKNNSIWSDVLIDQTLSQDLNTEAAVRDDDKSLRIKRGAESYERPSSAGGGRERTVALNRTNRKPKQEVVKKQLDDELEAYTSEVTEKPVISDQPFDSTTPEPPIEEFGVEKSKAKTQTCTNRKRQFQNHHRNNNGRPHHHHRRNNSRNRTDKDKMDTSSDMNVDLTTDMAPEKLGQLLAFRLKENKKDLLVQAVKVIGAEMSLKLYNQTHDIEEAGGLMVRDGSRRRTPGGVFLFLLREDKSIPQEQKDELWKEQKADDRNFAKAKRRFNRPSFEDKLKDMQCLIKRSKDRNEQVDEGLKDLETKKEWFLRETRERPVFRKPKKDKLEKMEFDAPVESETKVEKETEESKEEESKEDGIEQQKVESDDEVLLLDDVDEIELYE